MYKHIQALRTYAERHRKDLLIIGALLLVAGITHSWNMFHYPYFENDEATYLARGWTFVTTGQLDPYTYRYEHAPFGWILIGIWLLITGGDLLFPDFLTSGRVFMLIVHLISTVLLYHIGKNLFNRWVGALAAIIFTLSPLAIYFQRRVLLDNILTMFLLASIYLLTKKELRISRILFSAVFFALAFLSKINTAVMAPALLYMIWKKTDPGLRRHALLQWCIVTGILCSSYFLLAIIKGELLPAPLDAGGVPTRVSLLDSLRLQAGRGDFHFPWEINSSFIQNILSWARKDFLIIVYGTIATVISALLAIKKYNFRVVTFLILAQVAFLARGKIVLDLYIIPLIPLVSLALAAVILLPLQMPINKWQKIVSALILSTSVIATIIFIFPQLQYTKEETNNQRKAIQWIEQNVPKQSRIAIDNYAYTNLRYQSGYDYADYMFMVEYDPSVRVTKFENDWRNIEYILLTHELVKQMSNGSLPFVREAFQHSELVADYRERTTSYIDLSNLISTNGDWAQVYKIKSRSEIIKQQSWRHFRANFWADYGQIVDPNNNGLTTAGAQASGMLRAFDQDDKNSFVGIWSWTKDHLRYRSTDKLISWNWAKGDDGTYALGDSNTTTDADIQIAHVLLLAEDKWPGNGYGDEAAVMIRDLWDQTVFSARGRYYIDASADGNVTDRLVNPSYFNPVAFGAFAAVDPDHDWNKLTNDSYTLLSELQAVGSTGLIPSWVVISPNGAVSSADRVFNRDTNVFDNQTARIVINLANSWYNTKDEKALASLKQFAEFFAGEIKKGNELASTYDLPSGAKSNDIDFTMQSAAILALYAGGYDDLADGIVKNAINAGYNQIDGYWSNAQDLFSQNMGWHAVYINPENTFDRKVKK